MIKLFLFLSPGVSGDVPLSPDVRRLARSVIRGQGLPASGGNYSHAEKEGIHYTGTGSLRENIKRF